jgi:hypothetical protein
MPRARLIVFVAALASTSAAPLGAVPVETLAQAEEIRADVQRRHSALVVTEASSTNVVHSFTLVSRSSSTRVVPTAEGVYYALCPKLARCPYPGRRGVRIRARHPRRVAFELAVRTFRATAANVVVVSLPTRQPVLFVLERSDVPERASGAALDQLTLAHLYTLLALVPVSDTAETLVLARL